MANGHACFFNVRIYFLCGWSSPYFTFEVSIFCGGKYFCVNRAIEYTVWGCLHLGWANRNLLSFWGEKRRIPCVVSMRLAHSSTADFVAVYFRCKYEKCWWKTALMSLIIIISWRIVIFGSVLNLKDI